MGLGLVGKASNSLKTTLRSEATSFPSDFTHTSEPNLCLNLSTQTLIFPSKGCPPGGICLWSVLTYDICQMNKEQKGNIETEKVKENKQRQEGGQAREMARDSPKSAPTSPLRRNIDSDKQINLPGSQSGSPFKN